MSGPTRPSQRALHVSASQTRREPLDKLQLLFGGRVHHRRQTHTGNIIYYWVLSSDARKVEEFLPQVMPYLVVKRREAEILMEFASTIRRRGRPKAGVVDHTSQEEIEVRERLIAELADIRGAIGLAPR